MACATWAFSSGQSPEPFLSLRNHSLHLVVSATISYPLALSLSRQYNIEPMASPTVLLGMSGGVDSSVAAALLVRQGYDVHGVTLQVWEHEDDNSRGLEKVARAWLLQDWHCQVCGAALKIPHEVIDTEKPFVRRDRRFYCRLSRRHNAKSLRPVQ